MIDNYQKKYKNKMNLYLEINKQSFYFFFKYNLFRYQKNKK